MNVLCPDGASPSNKIPARSHGSSARTEGCRGQAGSALSVARRAYHEQDSAALPVLADALEDDGYRDAALLGHLRGPGPHVRG
jgi:hypothetical protein